jgi:predicted ArsR family transcriptional regulator
VEELTIKDIADKLGLLPVTVKKRLQKHGIKPLQYVGTAGIYDPAVLDIIKKSGPKGRPKKT